MFQFSLNLWNFIQGPFLSQFASKTQKQDFCQKSLPNHSFYAAVTSRKKSESLFWTTYYLKPW